MLGQGAWCGWFWSQAKGTEWTQTFIQERVNINSVKIQADGDTVADLNYNTRLLGCCCTSFKYFLERVEPKGFACF